MTRRSLYTIAASLCLSIGSVALAQDAGGGAGGGAAGGGAGGAGGGRGGRGGFQQGGGFQPGGPGGFTQRADGLRETVSALGELNLSTTFTLTDDQKSKIQVIRDDYKKATDKWEADNKDAQQKLRDEARNNQGGGDIREKFRALMETRPKSDEAVKAIIAVLTGDQAKALAAKQSEVAAERDRLRQEMASRFQQGGGFGRGGQQGGAGGAGGAQQGGQQGGRRGGGGGGAGGAAPGGNRGGGAGGAGAGGI